MCYSAVSLFLLNPNFALNFLNKKTVISTILIVLIFGHFIKIDYMPLGTILKHFNYSGQLLPALFHYIIYIFSVLYTLIISHLIIKKYLIKDVKGLFYLILNLLMTFTSFKIVHQFSSRYIAQFAFLSLNLAPKEKTFPAIILQISLLIVGMLAGINSLLTYYTL